MADDYKISNDDRGPCVEEARSSGQAWFEMLSANMIAGDGESRARRPPPGPDFMTIEYTQSKVYEAEREFIIRTGLLEAIRDGFWRTFMIRPGITLRADDCSEANAFWQDSGRTLTICYELVRQYRKLAVGAVTKDGGAAANRQSDGE